MDYTIDASGNIIPKPYGVSRWANPRVRECKHEECVNAAVLLERSPKAHNCCGEHEHD